MLQLPIVHEENPRGLRFETFRLGTAAACCRLALPQRDSSTTAHDESLVFPASEACCVGPASEAYCVALPLAGPSALPTSPLTRRV